MNKRRIHNKFNKIVNKAVNQDDTKKYMVSKAGQNKYSYHSFIVEKIADDSYNCTQNGKLVYTDVATFQLALTYCYNYLFKKSNRVTKQLTELNNEANKQKLDLLYYRNYLQNSSLDNKDYMYARINESNNIFKRIRNEIRTLSTSI